LPRRYGDAKQAEHGDLHARATRCVANRLVPRTIILADRAGWNVEAELRHFARNMGQEGIAVWPWPRAIVGLVRVGGDRGFDLLDQRLSFRAAHIDQQGWRGTV